ncbi:MAG: hypothetical protein JKY27_00750 [Magnetovibrio sp.]|nr:hypothetical protein [Magnetovibrio sp.]
MQSDILILLKTAPSALHLSKVKVCLMNVNRSVLVHQKEGAERLLLIKFDPNGVTPSELLSAVHGAGFDATMAGC